MRKTGISAVEIQSMDVKKLIGLTIRHGSRNLKRFYPTRLKICFRQDPFQKFSYIGYCKKNRFGTCIL